MDARQRDEAALSAVLTYISLSILSLLVSLKASGQLATAENLPTSYWLQVFTPLFVVPLLFIIVPLRRGSGWVRWPTLALAAWSIWRISPWAPDINLSPTHLTPPVGHVFIALLNGAALFAIVSAVALLFFDLSRLSRALVRTMLHRSHIDTKRERPHEALAKRYRQRGPLAIPVPLNDERNNVNSAEKFDRYGKYASAPRFYGNS